MPGSDLGDVGSDTAQQDVLQTQSTYLYEQINAIETALRRMDEGTYGTCVECGKSIPEA